MNDVIARRLTLCSCVLLGLTFGCRTGSRVSELSPVVAPPAAAVTVPQPTLAPKESQESAQKHAAKTERTQSNIEQTNFEDIAPPPATEIIPAEPVDGSVEAPAELNLSGTGVTLETLEQWAIQNNPAIAQASASASKATGFKQQVGARPNPNLGYSGQQIDDKGTDQHLGFIEQEFVTANKLQLNERVLDQEVQSQLWEVHAQRFRVLTDVRMRFYEALAAQQRIDLATEFQLVASEGVRVAEIRREALEGSLPEVLQTEIQLNEVELIQQRAQIAYETAWKQLTAVVGVPHLAPTRLVGELRLSSERRDWDLTYQELLQSNPALQAARARVSRSIANMTRQEVQAIPNLQTQTAFGYDNGTQHSMLQFQVGIALPLYNKNQGNISAAQAEYCRAVQDVRRMELELKSKLAEAARQYDSAALTVERYETRILPKASQTLTLSEKAYSVGEFDFLQVLVARRTFFDSNLEYNVSLLELAQAKWLIDGFLLQGGLNETTDTTFDDGLRGQTLSGQ
ncbi:TolC family protein [Planctomicrobium sp. SH668]|uniref:TolC family protein n=1 Tax=Planctomicrobium sp. SH668 TaxID=3448126 RepID=UPI003F5C63F6